MRSHTIAVLIAKESLLMRSNRSVHRTQAGFALVLALLALLLLTFLGLTLAVTTSTELQIATNYRWTEQARYVAEAGVEAGKVMLRGIVEWEEVLPAARMGGWTGAGPINLLTPRAGIRDWEGGDCDYKGDGVGYGRVLDFENAEQQYVSTFRNRQLTGAFTLWVRRPLHLLPDGTIVDWGGPPHPMTPTAQVDHNNLILVAEGMAPFTGAPNSAMMHRSKATYVIEVALSRNNPMRAGCDAVYSGQTGKGTSGANSSFCERMQEGPEALASAVAGSSASGTLADTDNR